ncbi:MAG: hypothetical protein AB7E13_10305 [Arcobacteraceae bacterium]
MSNYIHIGYPKNLSTTLQIDFFAKHSQLNHLGMGYGGENLKYINSDMSIYMEALLRSRDISFNNIKEELHEKIKAELPDAFGISHENLSYHFSNDEVDLNQKVERLFSFFGKNTKIIVIVRNQFSLIKSLYKESLKSGLSINFYDYINMLYKNKFHSYLNEFQFDKVIGLYEKKFGLQNILILPLEEYRRNGNLLKNKDRYCLLEKICEFLNINYENIDLNPNNPSMDDEEAFHLLELNKQYRYNLGRGNYYLIDKHKYIDVFDYLGYKDSDIYFDVKIKRNLIEYSKELAKNDLRKIDYYANPKILKKLEELFIVSNEKLAKNYNLTLPDSYFKMEF